MKPKSKIRVPPRPPNTNVVWNPPVSLSDILMLVFAGIVIVVISGIAGALLSRAC